MTGHSTIAVMSLQENRNKKNPIRAPKCWFSKDPHTERYNYITPPQWEKWPGNEFLQHSRSQDLKTTLAAVLLESVKRLAMIGQSPLIIYLPILSLRRGPLIKTGPVPRFWEGDGRCLFPSMAEEKRLWVYVEHLFFIIIPLALTVAMTNSYMYSFLSRFL